MASIYQREYTRKDGTTYKRWCCEVTDSYNKKYFYGKTKREVEQKVNAYQTELTTYGSTLKKTNPTLESWIYEYLFLNVHPKVCASTFERSKSIYDNHILHSSLGKMPLKNIQLNDIQQLLNEKKHLSSSSLKKIRQLLHGAFKSAISNNLIRINPVAEVNLPKSDVPAKDIEILSVDEQKSYVTALSQEKYSILYLSTLFTGMRLGEVIALKWSNVDLINGSITVCESYKRVRKYNEDGTYFSTLDKKAPKTNKGIRTIPLPNFLVSNLRIHKLAQKNSAENLVFCTDTGSPLSDANVRKYHDRICKNAKIRPISFHALRHTFATRMIENKVDVKTVSELLGHTSIEITLNTYVHSTVETKRATANMQDSFYNQLMSAH